MKEKRFLKFGLLVFAILAMLISSCSSEAATQEAEQAPAGEEVEDTTPAEPVKLTFWHQYDKANAEMIDQLVAEFNETNPDIQVEVVVQPSYDEYKTLLQTSILSNTLPDIATVDLIWVPWLVSTDSVEALDNYIASDSDFDITDFYPLQLDYDNIGGSRFALPMSANNMQVIWNKDLFEQAGLDPEVPPTTWEEMKADAEQCQDLDNGIVGFEFYTQPTGEGITWQFQVFLWAAGGEFLNADNTKAAFNTPEGLEALTYVSDMLQGNGSIPGPWGAFGEGKACMQLDGSWLFGYRSDAPFDWGVALVPAPEGGTSATNTGGERILMFSNSENKEAAWKFIKFMTSSDVQLRWDMTTGFMPVRKSVGDNPEYLNWINETEPRMLPFVEGMQYAHTRPATPLYNEVSDAFSREIQNAFLGLATPEEALAAAEQAVNDILAQ